MHEAAFHWIEQAAAWIPWKADETMTVLEIGSRVWSGPLVRSAFPRPAAYLGVDLTPGEGVNLLWDAHCLPALGLWDVVIAAEVLEHDDDVPSTVRGMVGAVKPGGAVIITCATADRSGHPGAPPRDPAYYRNVAPDELLECFPQEWGRDATMVTAGNDLYFRIRRQA